jgi:hypothetical protein
LEKGTQCFSPDEQISGGAKEIAKEEIWPVDLEM